MIDGDLANNAAEPSVCDWQACQWPDGLLLALVGILLPLVMQ